MKEQIKNVKSFSLIEWRVSYKYLYTMIGPSMHTTNWLLHKITFK
jgi:hypothetical protein